MNLLNLKEYQNSLIYKIVCITIFIFGIGFFIKSGIRNINYSSKEILLDFPAYYIAGKSISNNFNPYDTTVTELVSNELNIPYTEFRSFLYPPQSLILFRELSKFPILESQKYFTIFKEIILIFSILLICYNIQFSYHAQDINKSNYYSFLNFIGVAFFLGAFLWPFKNDFLNGQINIIIFAVLCISFISSERFPIIAGFMLGIGIIVKLSPLLMFPYFLFRSKISTILYTIFFCTIFSIISIALFGYEIHAYYIKHLIFGTVSGDTIPNLGWPYSIAHNQSIKGFFHRVFVSDYSDPHFGTEVIFHFPILGRVFTNIVILYIIFLILKVSLPPINFLKKIQNSRVLFGLNLSKKYNPLIFGLYLSATNLFSPLSWVHHKVVLLFPILVCLKNFLYIQKRSLNLVIYFIILIFAILLLTINHLYPYNRVYFLGIFISYIHLIGNLLIFIVCYKMLVNKYV